MKIRRFFAGFIFISAGFAAVFFAIELRDFLSLKRANAEVEKRLRTLAGERDRLNLLSDALEKNDPSDPRIERLIRERLGLIKDGEKVFIFGR